MPKLQKCIRCNIEKQLNEFFENKKKKTISKVCLLCRYPKKDEKTRLYEKIIIQDGCWGWKASINHRGYGAIRFKNKKMNAHRASWIIHTGIDPKEKNVCHKCDNRLCCNPDHLFLGTHQDNMDDMLQKGRRVNIKGEQCPWAKLTQQDIHMMLALFEKGFTNKAVGKLFNIHGATAGEIKRGEIWGHVGDRSRIIKKNTHEKKLDSQTVLLVRKRLDNNEKPTDIALDYNLNTTSIYNIKAGKTWKNIT